MPNSKKIDGRTRGVGAGHILRASYLRGVPLAGKRKPNVCRRGPQQKTKTEKTKEKKRAKKEKSGKIRSPEKNGRRHATVPTKNSEEGKIGAPRIRRGSLPRSE